MKFSLYSAVDQDTTTIHHLYNKIINQLHSLFAHKWSCSRSLHKIQYWTENATDENWFGEKRKFLVGFFSVTKKFTASHE